MKQHKLKILFIFSVVIFSHSNLAQADCKDPELRQKLTQTAKTEGVNEREPLSIIAHESGCRYYTIAWNLPVKVQTAKSKFLDTLEDAKALAEDLIATKKFRVDVGIGQINNEAHIQPKGWSLEEVLNPKTALNRVAQVLKERGWANYHSNNPVLAKKWQGLALAALDKIDFVGETKTLSRLTHNKSHSKGSLLVFNGMGSNILNQQEKLSWVIYGERASSQSF